MGKQDGFDFARNPKSVNPNIEQRILRYFVTQKVLVYFDPNLNIVSRLILNIKKSVLKMNMPISSTLGENNRKRKSGKYIFFNNSLNTDNDQMQNAKQLFVMVSKTIKK